jgi:hypothetical protein
MYPYFQAIAAWPISRAINESAWIFATVQAFHLVALAFLAGALLIVDLRLLGKGFTQQPVSRVARDARKWLLWSIVAMVVTGVPQFISLATKEYDSVYFRTKMFLLLVALIYTFTIRQRVIQAPDGRYGPGVAKLVAIISIVLWANIAIQGRLIGFFS